MKNYSVASRLASVAAMAFACAPALAQEQLTITYNTVLAEAAYLSKLDKTFIETVKERSEGRISFDAYYSETLGGQKEIIPLLTSGAITIGGIITGYHFGQMPFSSLPNSVPGVFTADNVIPITRRMYDEDPAVVAEFGRIGIRPLMYRHFGPYTLLCKQPIRTLSDFKGLKVRTYGAYIPALFEAVGAVPVSLPSNEQYEALQRGTIDCSYWSRPMFEAAGLYEVAKYLMDFDFGSITGYTMFVANDVWNGWDEETRTLIDTAAREAEALSVPVTEEADAEAVVKMQAAGVELVAFEDRDALDALLPDMMEIWGAEVLGKFPDQAAAVENTKQMLEGLLK